MKILAIGDPHGNLATIKKIPLKGVDLILLTGDLGNADMARKMDIDNFNRKRLGLKPIKYSRQQQKKVFMEIYDSAIKIVKYLSKFAPVYLIHGNVEKFNFHPETLRGYKKRIGTLPSFHAEIEKLQDTTIINNRLANFKGIRIGGLEYFIDLEWLILFTPSDYEERHLTARKETTRAKKVLQKFGNLDILVCHQPPYGYLDTVKSKNVPKDWQGKHAGSKTILDYIKKYHPKYVFCGHIHEGEGKAKIGNTKVYNLSVAGYKIINI